MQNTDSPIGSPAKPETALPIPRRASLMTRLRRVGSIVAVAYVLVCVAFYFMQDQMIFPGTATHAKQDMQVAEAPTTKLIHLQLNDGSPIVARYDLAANANPNQAPVVLLFYGNGQCAKTTGGVIYLFQQLGFNVLTPDYPGYGMSDGTPSELSLFATADACWEYLQRQGNDRAPAAVHIVGWSLGTGVAIDLASRVQAKSLTTISAYTSMDAMARLRAPFLPTFIILKHHFNNLDKIAKVQCPILMIHGQKDDFIPVEMSQALAARATAPVTTLYPPESDHNNIFDLDLKPLLSAMQSHLK